MDSAKDLAVKATTQNKPNLIDQEKDQSLFFKNTLMDDPKRSMEDTVSEKLEKISDQPTRANTPSASPEDTRSELLNAEAKRLAEVAKLEREEKDLQERLERERRQSQDNSLDVKKSNSHKELGKDDVIIPASVRNNYHIRDGNFYGRDDEKLVFQDKGEKLTTATIDKNAIKDMIEYAKAKQWDSIKLSGSQEFRREAWLHAESQGIKTSGYTPKEKDLAVLDTMTRERQNGNAITQTKERTQTPEKERSAISQDDKAPRHDLNKNQAAIHTGAIKNIQTNREALEKTNDFSSFNHEEMEKLAYWRGVVIEDNKHMPKALQDEALSQFDKKAQDPAFLKKMEQQTTVTIQERTIENTRTEKTKTSEMSL